MINGSTRVEFTLSKVGMNPKNLISTLCVVSL